MITRSLRLLAAASLAMAAAAFAQTPTPPANAGAPGAQAQRRPMPAPTNLKVLPKDTTGQQVIALMRGYEGALGVECGYCHAKDAATGRNNFASDDNPMKDKARLMMKMTDTINGQFVSTLSPKAENPVGCGTCHRGIAKPTVFVPPPPAQRPAAPPAGSPPTGAGR